MARIRLIHPSRDPVFRLPIAETTAFDRSTISYQLQEQNGSAATRPSKYSLTFSKCSLLLTAFRPPWLQDGAE